MGLLGSIVDRDIPDEDLDRHVEPNGLVLYYLPGTNTLHRTAGPAVDHPDGAREWWRHGRRHHDGGPALENASGQLQWFHDNHLHRTDGPAIERADGRREWWLHGKKVTWPQFDRLRALAPDEQRIALALIADGAPITAALSAARLVAA